MARVRLIRPHGNVPLGAEGVVNGFYRRSGGDLISVNFGERLEKTPVDSLAVVATPTEEQSEAD